VVKRPGWILAAIFLGALALRAPALVEPWGADQSVFAFIARRMLDGQVPYRDLWSTTGYGIFFAYAGLFLALGKNMLALHAGDLAASLAAVWLVYAAASRIAGLRAGLWAAALQALFGAGISFSALYQMGTAAAPYWSLAQRESFMGPLLAGAFLLVLPLRGGTPGGPRAAMRWTGMGALVGLAAVLKFTAAGFLPVLALAPLFDRDGGPAERRALRALVCLAAGTAGFVLAQVPFALWFAAHGALGDMIRAVFVQTSEYARLSRGTRLETALYGHGTLIGESLAVWALAAAAAAAWIARGARGPRLFAVLTAAAALASIWAQGKFFGYHFLVVFPFLTILAGAGAAEIFEGGRTASAPGAPGMRLARWSVAGLLLVSAGIFGAQNYSHLRWDLLRITGLLDEAEYAERFNEYPQHFYSYRSDREVALWLRENAPPGASLRLINDGGELVIFQEADLVSPTRFTSSWYLFNQGLLNEPGTRALREEFVRETIAARPDYLLLVFYPLADWPSLYPLDSDPPLKELYSFVRNDYVLERSFRDGRDLYRRKP